MSSAGQALGGVVGAVAGFFVGGPQGALYGAQLGLAVGGALDPPKGPNIQGPRLSDLSVQTATYGAVIPRAYGTIATHGNVFWLQGDELTEVAAKSTQGGKGGGPSSSVTSFSYFATFAVGLCQGPIAGIRRIWIGPDLFYDAGSADLETILASNAAAEGFTLYLGTETQLPDPLIQADRGVADTPAYTGLAYIVFEQLALADYGNTLQAAQVKVEVIQVATPVGLTLLAEETQEYTPYTVTGGVGGGSGTPYNGYCGFATPSHMRWYLPDWDNSTPPNPRQFYVYDVRPGSITFDGVRAVNRVAAQEPPPVLTDSTELYYGSINELFSPPPTQLSNFGALQGRVRGTWAAVTSTRSGVHAAYLAPIGTPAAFFQIAGIATAGAVEVTEAGDVYYFDASGARRFDSSGALVDTVAFAFDIPTTSVEQPRAYLSDDGNIYLNTRFATASQLYRISQDLTSIALVGNVAHVFNASGDDNYDITVEDGVFARFCVNSNAGATDIKTAWFSLAGVAGDLVPLADIVEAECLQSALLTAGDLDVSELTQLVRGYKVGTVAALRAALEPLQGAYPFDIVQSGYQIAFRVRGRAPVATVTADELDARGGSDQPGQRLTILREMDTQLPRTVSLGYLDVDREYDVSQQSTDRISTESVNRRSLQFALVLDADEAAQRAEVLLWLYWLERYDLRFTLPDTYLDLEPADVITIQHPDATYEARITAITYTADQRLECHAKLNDTPLYTSAALGDRGDSTETVIALEGPSEYVLVDGPTLLDSLDAPGVLGAMHGFSAAWPGGTIHQTRDSGTTWPVLGAFAGPVPMGNAFNPIGAPDEFDVVDEENVLRATIIQGALESVTLAQMLNGANHFAYGAAGRWEILAARDCTQEADGSWTLQGLLRGRFGSEWAAGSHAIGDTLVLLTDADVQFIGLPLVTRGVLTQTRGITSGATIDTDADREFTYNAENLLPLSPVYLNGNRHPSTRDWTLTWTRRTRIGGEWMDFVDAPLGETSESYEVDVFSGSVVVRTLSASTPTVAYTSAQQVADFGSNQGTLSLRVYQLSSTVGRGRPLIESITRG